MASVNERLARLERRAPPPYEPNPWTDLLLKTTAHARAELDGEDPDPLVLTLEEKRLELEAAERFLPYLDGERGRTEDPDTLRTLDDAQARTRAEIAELKEEIETEGEQA